MKVKTIFERVMQKNLKIVSIVNEKDGPFIFILYRTKEYETISSNGEKVPVEEGTYGILYYGKEMIVYQKESYNISLDIFIEKVFLEYKKIPAFDRSSRTDINMSDRIYKETQRRWYEEQDRKMRVENWREKKKE